MECSLHGCDSRGGVAAADIELYHCQKKPDVCGSSLQQWNDLFKGFGAGFALGVCCGVVYREKVGDGVCGWAWTF